MKFKLSLGPLLGILYFTFFLSYSHAWEQNVHESALYHALRASGIAHEVSLLIAKGSQKVDETPESSATKFSDQRELNHFLTDSTEKAPATTDHSGAPEGMIGKVLNFFGIGHKFIPAVQNAALGYYMIYKGVMTGDLISVSAGFHHLADAHSRHVGNTAAFGHGHQGHTTDATYLHTKEFQETIVAFCRVATRIRFLLPKKWQDTESALKYLNTINPENPVTEEIFKDPNSLAQRVLRDENLNLVYRTNIQHIREYKLIALQRFYDYYIKAEALNPELKFNDLFTDSLINDSSFSFEHIIKELILKSNRGDALHIITREGKSVPVFTNFTNFFKNGTKVGPSARELELMKKDAIKEYMSKIESLQSNANIVQRLGVRFALETAPVNEAVYDLISKAESDEIAKNLKLKYDKIFVALMNQEIDKAIILRVEFIAELYKHFQFENNPELQAKLDKINAEIRKANPIYLKYQENMKSYMELKAEIFQNATIKDYDVKNSEQMRQLATELAINRFANNIASRITAKFIPKYNGADSQFTFESDKSGNRMFEVNWNKDMWRNYLNSAWNRNFISLSEENPTIKQKIKYWLGFKLELPQLPGTETLKGISDIELTKLAAEGDPAASFELSKRSVKELSPVSHTEIEAAEVVRLTYGFKQEFTKVMLKYYQRVLAFNFIPSGKKWDKLYSEAKGEARLLFYQEIEKYMFRTVSNEKGETPPELSPETMKGSKKRAKVIIEQINLFARGNNSCRQLFTK